MNLLCHTFIWICRIALGCVCAAVLALVGAVVYGLWVTPGALWELLSRFGLALLLAFGVLLVGVLFEAARERVSRK